MDKKSTPWRKNLEIDQKSYTYWSLAALAKSTAADLNRLPYALRILLEGCLRNSDQGGFSSAHVEALLGWQPDSQQERPAVPFLPARILMQDFTGLPVLNDMTALRSALKKAGQDSRCINPRLPVDVVIDHSVQVDAYGCPEAQKINEEREFDQNCDRYLFLKWSQSAYDHIRVLPPGLGICHQVNLEYLASAAFQQTDGNTALVYPDSVLGTDSHTPMINGLGILGWGVGGIEALAAMLGYPSEFSLPDVVGLELVGKLPAGTTPTDLTLTITSRLRQVGVVGKFVEVFGESYPMLPVETRAMIANMSPESGATTIYFPVDYQTLDYLRRTGRSEEHIGLVEHYYREQGLWHDAESPQPQYSQVITIHLSEIEPLLAGPKRPQDILPLRSAPQVFKEALSAPIGPRGFGVDTAQANISIQAPSTEHSFQLTHGSVLIAAITSCTNTSDAGVMLAAGLLARNAAGLGLKSQPWVKTSLAPGSRAVSQYLRDAGLQEGLEALGFHTVGYGCTTCIGNSGPLDPAISQAVREADLVCTAVLSGNRNFEGRIHPDVRASFLASPPLVVAYALAGHMDFDFTRQPLGFDDRNQPVFLKDIYPSQDEIEALAKQVIHPDMYVRNYQGLYQENPRWNSLPIPETDVFPWEADSTLIKEPGFLIQDANIPVSPMNIQDARALVVLGDSITTDHISPAGRIAPDIIAGDYLQSLGVAVDNFISFGARRGNHEVMVRGTFSNPRLRNLLTPEREGGFTRHIPSGDVMPIFEAAERYRLEQTPLIILAGKAYGSGSSRDWAAKGTYLLGVRAVLAESYERIHRTNLVCMGVLPLQFAPGTNAESLGLRGDERFRIEGIANINDLRPQLRVTAHQPEGKTIEFQTSALIETPLELTYFQAGGLARKILEDMQASRS